MTMIFAPTSNPVLYELISKLEIPDSYYEKAVARYHALGEWFCRPASEIQNFEPSIHPQGSFRLGTAIRPLTSAEEYDIDLVCELRGLSKKAITQKELKARVGAELQAYARANGFNAPVQEGKRAWRLEYADGVSFHLDILACIPEDQRTIEALVSGYGISRDLAVTAIALTCKSHPEYGQITPSWPTSNPAGYGRWFERKMHEVARAHRDQLVKEGRYDSVANVPMYALKTPLQQTIQLLKRHRDTMFRHKPDLKPISMLVTTLAARAYLGETDLTGTVRGVLSRMPQWINQLRPYVPNPVNLGEDFADKWAADPKLRQAFYDWLYQARLDFDQLFQLGDAMGIVKHADSRFAVPVTEARAAQILGPATTATPSRRAPQVVVREAPKPWAKHRK
jgi:hypothetical protein